MYDFNIVAFLGRGENEFYFVYGIVRANRKPDVFSVQADNIEDAIDYFKKNTHDIDMKDISSIILQEY